MKWYRTSRFPASFRVGFLIAGVQKAGTFSLFQLLRQHPNIGMSTAKEVHFFDDETTVDWSKPASLRCVSLTSSSWRRPGTARDRWRDICDATAGTLGVILSVG